MKISCFFPMYNEGENIRTVVAAAVAELGKVAEEFEVIVVNDGSSDRTAEVAGELARADRRVRLVSHEKNQGYGAALRSGFKACRHEIIFQCDGDDQFYLEEIGNLLPFINDHDFVIGFRIKRMDSFPRLLFALFYRTLLRLLFGLRLKDPNCAFKLFKKSIIDRLDLESSGAVINGEIFLKARKLGYNRIKEVGVHHRSRQKGAQTGGSIKVLLTALKSVQTLWRINRDFKGPENV